MNRKKRVLILGSAVLLVFVISIIVNLNFRLTGFSVFEGGCANSINNAGYWELNGSIGCANSTGITVNSSNVVLDCKGSSLSKSGGNDSESYGVYVHGGKGNVSIWNCNISGFGNAIFVGSGANVSVVNTSGQASGSCVSGNWTDNGGNRGCLDIREPAINITNQTIYTNQSFSYQINASDVSLINSYSLNGSVSGGNATNIFSINSSGVIENASALLIGNYSLNVVAKDVWNNSANAGFYVFVLNSTTQTIETPAQENTEEYSSEDETTGEAAEENTAAGDNTQTAVDCSNAWECAGWGECANSERTRECTKKKQECNVAKPAVSESCTVELVACIENWECNWGECINSTKQALDCRDLNACNTTANKPETKACEVNETIRGRSFLTGAAISSLIEGTKSLPENFIRFLNEKDKTKGVRIAALVVIFGAFLAIAYVFMRQRIIDSYVKKEKISLKK